MHETGGVPTSPTKIPTYFMNIIFLIVPPHRYITTHAINMKTIIISFQTARPHYGSPSVLAPHYLGFLQCRFRHLIQAQVTNSLYSKNRFREPITRV